MKEEIGILPYVLFCIILSLGVALGNEFIIKPFHIDRTLTLLLLVGWLLVVVYVFWKVDVYRKSKGKEGL